MFYAEIRLALFLAFVAFVLYLVARQARGAADVLKLHLEGRNRLIDRFGDADAFLAFARSEEGRAILHPPQPSSGGARVAGLRLFQSAILCLALGAGWYVSGVQSPGGGQEARTLGVLLGSTGVGLLLAGLLAWLTRER